MSDTDSQAPKPFSGRTLIYSNRPPSAGSSGGAQMVIEATNPTWWVGPESVDNRLWNVMEEQERQTITLAKGPNNVDTADYHVLTFPTPKALEDAQYKTISNEVLWPLAHSMKPNAKESLEQIEDAYFNGYLPYNELANNALRTFTEEKSLTANDRVWVHDYQCDNVPGMIYSRHIPWPSLEFLEETSFKSETGKDVPILETAFFRDLIELGGNRALSTFQRPVDQVNYLMTAAALAGSPENFSIQSENAALENITTDIHDPAKREAIRTALSDEIGLGTSTRITLFGSPTTLMNVPVGQNPEMTHESAVDNEHLLNKTTFKTRGTDDWNIFNASLGDGQTANLTASDPKAFSEENPPRMADLVEPIRGRNWVLSVHRNDYTKGTLTKLKAARELFETEPERAKDSTFVFILQPTREDVGGYREYAEQVFKEAKALRDEFGEKSVVIIPEAVKHDDILAVMRQPEMKGFMGLGHKDGHDLTLREVVDANDKDRAIGVIASSGVGAADVLNDGKRGAEVIQNPSDAKEVAAALSKVLNPANDTELKANFNFMKEQSNQYDSKNFSDTITAAYPAAMKHRFGKQWKQEFSQPDGDYIDRKGERHAPEQERPAFLKALLNEEVRQVPAPQRGR